MAGKIVEIDETELLANRQLAANVQAILAKPAARRLLLQAHKVVNPNVSIPELDAAQPVEEEIGKLRAEIAADKAERAKEKEDAAAAKKLEEFKQGWEQQRLALIGQGWTEEGLKKVEEHAQKEGIGSLRAAANDWEKLNPQTGSVMTPGRVGFDPFSSADRDDETFKKLFASQGDDPMALDKLINSARGR